VNQTQRHLLIFAGGVVAHFAIRNMMAPEELPTAEGNDLVMENQAGNSALGMDAAQFDRLMDDIVTINGVVVILLPNHKFNTTDYCIVSPDATREQLNLIVSQVNNALRNKTQFSTVQEVKLKDLSTKAHRALVVSGVQQADNNLLQPERPSLSLDGIF